MPASGNSPTGFGLELVLATSTGFDAALRIRDTTEDQVKRSAIDMTHTQSPDNRMQFEPSKLVDPGEIKVTLILPKGVEPPIDEKPEVMTIKYPLQDAETAPAQVSGSGFFTDFGKRLPLNDRMEMNCTIKKTGKWTYAAAT
jgi:hypothetical protein